MPVFQTPVEDAVPPIYIGGQDRFYPVPKISQKLFRHYKNRARGVSVLKNGSTYTQHRYPSTDDIEAADITYMGGRCYVVSTGEADNLQAAGYTTTDRSTWEDIWDDVWGPEEC